MILKDGIRAKMGETCKGIISNVCFTFGVFTIVDAVVGATASLKISGAFIVYESLFWVEEYRVAPDGECEHGSTFCLKGLLDEELGGNDGNGDSDNSGFIGGKLASAKNLLSFTNDLIANGLAEGYLQHSFPYFLKDFQLWVLLRASYFSL